MKRREFNKFAALFPFLMNSAVNAQASQSDSFLCKGSNFKCYNQLHFKNMPDVRKYGFDPITFVYAGQMWPDRKAKNNLDTEYIIEKYKDTKLSGDDNLLCLDIENWRVRRASHSAFRKSVSNFREVIAIFRDLFPGVRIGVFEYAPLSFYPLYDQFVSGNVSNRLYTAWQEEIDRIKIITDSVDVLFPQLYSRWPHNPAGWVRCARRVMSQAREIAHGRQVIPVVWPQYWLRDKSAPLIPGEEWSTILDTMYELADSLIFWSIYKTAPKWDDHAEWWSVTKEFMANNNKC